MDTHPTEATTESTVPDRPDLEDVTSYEEGDALVVCDRSVPSAWLRSDHTVPIRQ